MEALGAEVALGELSATSLGFAFQFRRSLMQSDSRSIIWFYEFTAKSVSLVELL